MKIKNKMKKAIHILFAFLMIFSSSIVAQQIDTLALQRDARKLVRQGNKLYKQEKYTDASVSYKKALGKDSQYKKASYNLGNALYQQKNYKEATPQFELAAKTATEKYEKAEAFHNLGNSMMEQKQYQPAVDAFKNAHYVIILMMMKLVII